MKDEPLNEVKVMRVQPPSAPLRASLNLLSNGLMLSITLRGGDTGSNASVPEGWTSVDSIGQMPRRVWASIRFGTTMSPAAFTTPRGTYMFFPTAMIFSLFMRIFP